MKFFNDILKSFTNEKGGASARKLTAFALMLCIAFIHFKHCNPENAVEFLAIDLCGVFLCLGLVTAGNIIELKNGSKQEQNENIS